MFKYYCLNPIAQVGLEKFTEEFEQTKAVEEAQGILVRSAAMHDMELSDNLLAVARAGAGYNNIPLERCAEKGIVVFNTPGANANGVKELVIAGMLLACRDIVGGINWAKSAKDDPDIAKATEKEKKKFAGTEVQDKKLGIIGLGAIGVKVANVAKYMGMEVYGYDPYVSVDSAWRLSRSIHHAKTVYELYEDCDYITIHVPLLDSTKGMINREAISLMKKGVIILNFANCDMVGHTGVYEAAVKAVETVDTCVGRVVDATRAMGGIAMITADHGNAEEMRKGDGSPMTAHTTNLVPFILVGADAKLHPGRLADIAPTILDIMGLACPPEMDGKSLID